MRRAIILAVVVVMVRGLVSSKSTIHERIGTQMALIMSCLSILGAIGIEWKSVKGKKLGPAAA